MGCGASTSNGQKQNDAKYQEDDEGEISDVASECSVKSDTSTSSKGVTKVTSTWGRTATSSTSTPYLLQKQKVYDPSDVLAGDDPAASPKSPEHFYFGDFAVDPKDAVRLRVERLNRIRRPSSHNLKVAVPKNGGTFVFNDLIMNTIDDEQTILPEPELKIVIPTGFKKLVSFSTTNLVGHTDRVKAIVLGTEEKSFLSAAITDTVIAMGDLSSGQELNCYPGHEAYIVALSLSRDGKFFASSARDGSIAVWEYSTNREHALKKQVRVFSPDEVQNTISIALAFSYSNRHLIAGGQDGCCRVWDIDKSDRSALVNYDKHSNVIVCVSPHPSEPFVASASGDKSIHVWQLETGELSCKLTGHESAVISVNYTLDGAKLLSNDDRSCRIWNAKTGEQLKCIRIDDVVRHAAPVQGRLKARAADAQRDFCRRYPSFMSKIESALVGPHTSAARAAQMERVTAKTIFTVSALLPGPLSNSYFAVACTTSEVLLVNLLTGEAEGIIRTKAPVFAMHTGSVEKSLFGDIFGNVYCSTFR